MAGITPLEGQDFIARVIYKQDLSPVTLAFGLFTNVTDDLVEASVWADIDQVDIALGGYSLKTFTADTWTVSSGGVATYPTQSWIATEDWPLDVYGYFIAATGSPTYLLHFEYSPNGARTMSNGNVYSVDLSSNTETS